MAELINPIEISTLKLSAEEQMLVSCAVRGDSEKSASTAELLSKKAISWDRFMKLVHWHRVSGLVFAYLRDNVQDDLIPTDQMEHLRGHYRHTAVRAMHIRSEFARAARALQANGIKVIALKGVALLDSVHEDPGTREMSDIDLLVSLDDADKAQEIVRGFGYEPVGTESVQEHTRQTHRHLPKLHNHSRELSFEIHTHFISSDSPLQFDIDSVWQKAQPATLHGVDVLVPSTEHMLMHLCVHFFLDRRFTSGSGIKQLSDIAGLIEHGDPKIDWDFFQSEVTRFGLDRPIFSVLSTVSVLFGSGIPAGVLTAMNPPDYSEKMQELFIRQRVLQATPITATELVPHQASYSYWAVAKSVWRRIMPSGRYMETHYGDEFIDAGHRTRLRRFRELFQRMFSYVRSPLRLWEEVQVDRWLHSLSSADVVTGTDRNRSG